MRCRGREPTFSPENCLQLPVRSHQPLSHHSPSLKPVAERSLAQDMPVKTSEPVLIVGGGAFGLCTVVHLLQAGFKDITVLDRDDDIPSAYSAANDLNKIVRAEYEDDFYTELTVVSLQHSHQSATLTRVL